MWIICLCLALGGDDGVVICKVTATYYVTYYGCGLLVALLISSTCCCTKQLQFEKQNKKTQSATQRICSDVRARQVGMDKVTQICKGKKWEKLEENLLLTRLGSHTKMP